MSSEAKRAKLALIRMVLLAPGVVVSVVSQAIDTLWHGILSLIPYVLGVLVVGWLLVVVFRLVREWWRRRM
jgi:hypothetical protein